MWDNPRQLNAAAGFLTALALTVFGAALAQLRLRSPLFPLQEIRVGGSLTHTTRVQIEEAARGRVAGNFFAVDLGAVRAAFEALPWVRRVEVRRVWPDRLEVTLEEHVALARWADRGLVSEQGKRFAGETAATLPLFAGPEGSEAELARRYLRFREILAPLGAAPARVVVSARRAWVLELQGGTTIALGRDAAGDPVEARLARFVASFAPSLGRVPEGVEHVDARYRNGFALRHGRAKGG